MKEMIKSYQMFIPKHPTYIRVLLYLIYPILVNEMFHGMQTNMQDLIGFVMAGVFYYNIELIMDMFFFPRVATREGCMTNYIQSSTKGKGLLKKALIGDCIRKFLTILLIYGLMVMCNVIKGVATIDASQALCILTMLFAFYDIQAIGNVLGRLTGNFSIRLLVLFFMTIPFVALVGYFTLHTEGSVILLFILVVVAVVISLLSVIIVIKQVEKSYVDKEAIL